jgi:hypothetical protein
MATHEVVLSRENLSRFPDASLRPRMRVEQCWCARAARRRGLSGARRGRGAGLRLAGAAPPAREARADARTRTADPFITSEVLYQLSYVGKALSLAAGEAGQLARPGRMTNQ